MHGGGWWSYISYDDSRGQPKIDRALLLRVGGWVRPFVPQILGMLALLLAIAVIELLPPLLYGRLIDALIPDPDSGVIALTPERLNLFAAGLLIAPVASSLLGVAQRHISASIGEGLIYDLRVAAYSHVQRLGLRFFTETRAGDIISRLDHDVIGAQTAVANTIPNLVSNILILTTTLVIMIRIEWRLTLLALAVLPLFLLPTRRVGRMLRGIRRESAEYSAELSSQLQETVNVSGALLVRVFGRQTASVEAFSSAAGKVRDIGVRQAVVGRWFFLGLGIAGAIGTALMYWAGGHLAILGPERGGITPGTIVTFAAYLSRLYGPITALSNVQVEFATSLVSFERVFEYLDLPIEITSPPNAAPLDDPRGHLRLEDVWFSYDELPPLLGNGASNRAKDRANDSVKDRANDSPNDGTLVDANEGTIAGTIDSTIPSELSVAGLQSIGDAERWSLREIDVDIPAGSIVALVGPSGAGKTTISYLVTRLYDPSRGRVLLDGRDLRQLPIEDIAANVGVVTQETFLFHDTIRANLLFARPDATESQLESACRAANIHDVISDLPDGYDTVVGERGYRLSGGEKQRLALARVILRDPTVLVLDEATSHLDSQSESLVQDALRRVMEGRTSLVIAHRLSTILSADQILVLDGGRIVERGRHDDLLTRGGLYAELFETQFSSPEAVAG